MVKKMELMMSNSGLRSQANFHDLLHFFCLQNRTLCWLPPCCNTSVKTTAHSELSAKVKRMTPRTSSFARLLC